MQNFKEWLLAKYQGKDTPRGDLAYDIGRDRDFPDTDDNEQIYEYLQCRLSGMNNRTGLAVLKRSYTDYLKSISDN